MLFYIYVDINLKGDIFMFRLASLILAGTIFTSFLMLSTNLFAADKSEEIKLLNAKQSYELIEANKNNPEFVVLDVRTSHEFNEGHLPNALNIDYKSADFKDKVAELDRNKTYITYCRSGRRSTAASEIMAEIGFVNIYMIEGGYIAWDKGNLPTDK